MAHDVKQDLEKKLVVIKHSDRVDKDDLWNARLAALKIIQDNESPRILVDMRNIDLTTTTMERFEFAQSHNKYFTSRTKIATLITKDDPKKQDHQFVETVSLNRGFLLRVFEDQGEAEQWLLG
ncbi:MAG: hypothetical protein RDU76_02390 [Candidatus Edwardsbacteria bacterium]|nr:hypothetical protein [Candidatus Edwardsbacteria bacterium]